MRIKLASLVAATLGVGISQAAYAADLPVKARPPAVMAPAPYNWTGLYIGAHIGAGWGTTETTVIDDGGLPWSQRDSNGFLGGGQIGLNYQTGWVVWGVEGTFSWADIDGTGPCGIANLFRCTTESKWIATVAGRVGGLVADRALVYVKGGGAWKDTDYRSEPTIFGDLATASEPRSGWLFGAGGEYAFTPNVTGFIEYNYMDFGTDRLTYALNGGTVEVDNTDKLHVIKAGLNYRFNWPAMGR